MAFPKSFYDKKRQGLISENPEKTIVDLHSRFYRDNSQTHMTPLNFVLTKGGIGDFVCWFVCLDWILKNHVQVKMKIFCPVYLMEVCKYFFEGRKNCTIVDRSTLTEKHLNKEITYVPRTDLFINGCGSSLVDLGFIYFANRSKAPDYANTYLEFDFKEKEVDAIKEKFNLPEKYFILTPGITDKNRGFKPWIMNQLIDYVLSSGLDVVFIGKKEITKERLVDMSEDYNWDKVIDLTDQTSLMEAAKIIEGAQGIAGVDNGLLHIAAMTTTPIIFGHTVMEPEFRIPKRKCGDVYSIEPTKEALPCRYCMTNMRFFFKKQDNGQYTGHDFKNCIYKDFHCLEAIAGDKNCTPWKDMIKTVLDQRIGS